MPSFKPATATSAASAAPADTAVLRAQYERWRTQFKTWGKWAPIGQESKGTTVFKSNRTSKFGLAWGNYNTTCLDPADPTIFWTYQEYATSSVPSQYTTCWVAFKLK